MSKLTPAAFRFMDDLQQNNNKPWFDQNRARYESEVFKPMKQLAEALAGPIASILPEFGGRPKLSRINNDIRFSRGKPLYKEHMWISFGGVVPFAADIFVGIDRKGWWTGAGVGAPKKDDLAAWHENLLKFSAYWLKWVAEREAEGTFKAHMENPYSKQLYPSAPAGVQGYLQAREVWLLYGPFPEFKRDVVEESFLAIRKMLPAYLFMTVPSAFLMDRIESARVSK